MRPTSSVPGGGRNPLTPQSALRIAALGSIAIALLGILVVRLWFLQVIGGQAYAQRAEENRIRTVELPAQRGAILDRNRRVIASVREGHNLVARPLDLQGKKRDEVIGRLSRLLRIPKAPMMKAMADGEATAPFESAVLVKDVNLRARTAFAERQREFPGVRMEKSYVRTYPQGARAAHLLGTVGPIFAEDVSRYRSQGYVGNEWVGKNGLEAQYESYLKGQKGKLTVEVNAAGQPVGRRILSTTSPQQGNTLVTSIDLPTQRALEEQLRYRVDNGYSAKSAAGVAINPQTGEVLGAASYPGFNPEDFARGRTARVLALNRDERQPLLPRFYQGKYPPASTMKAVTLSAALETGITKPGDVLMSENCVELYGTEFCNFGKEFQGSLSLPQSLEASSDVIYYRFGAAFYRRWRDQQGNPEIEQRWANRFSLGEKTGIDLPGEDAGVIPTPAYKEAIKDRLAEDQRPWLPGDNINMSIGQGLVEVTPLQMAIAYAPFANGGKRLTPTVGLQVETPAGSVVRRLAGANPPTEIGLKPTTIQIVREGLEGAANGSSGTATAVFGPVAAAGGPRVAGKTGTAENFTARDDHSWFVGYAPADKPTILVAIMIEGGGTGAGAAAPAVCAVMARNLKFDASTCGVSTRKSN